MMHDHHNRPLARVRLSLRGIQAKRPLGPLHARHDTLRLLAAGPAPGPGAHHERAPARRMPTLQAAGCLHCAAGGQRPHPVPAAPADVTGPSAITPPSMRAMGGHGRLEAAG